MAVYVITTAAVPYQYGQYILPLLVTGLIVCIFAGDKIDVAPLFWTIGLTVLGLLGVAIGLYRDNAGAMATTSIYVAEPIVLGLLFCCLATDPHWTKSTLTILDFALIATAALGIMVFLSSGLGIHIPPALLDPNYSTADTAGSTLRTNYQGYNSFVFLGPYGVIRFLRHQKDQPLLWSLLLLVSSLSGIILSGRRILYIAVPLSVLAIISLTRLARKGADRNSLGKLQISKPLAGILGIAAIVAILQGIGLHPLDAAARMAGQFTLGDADDKRAAQGSYLLQAWAEHPILGSGAGATIPGYSRNDESPWAFELSYHLVLFNFGIVGLGILLAWGAWILRRIYQGLSQAVAPSMAAIAAGFFGTVISIYVDPYVHKLDGMWMLFIPFAAAAYALRHQQTEPLEG